jgi:hypothetical protein
MTSHFAVLLAILAATRGEAQSRQTVVGCWKVESDRFSVIGKIPVDSGGTRLPSLVWFDTVPGQSLRGEPLGRLVRAWPDGSGTPYRNGYYLVLSADSLRVEWTNGFVGMTLLLRTDSLSMWGRASAWTDYMGHEQASVTLRRTACPGAG